MKVIHITTEFIKLDQLLKLAEVVSSGGEAKMFIQTHPIMVNKVAEDRRGRKLRHGDVVICSKGTFQIEQDR